jgi:PPP family 3-phenylpropionic acid transporter
MKKVSPFTFYLLYFAALAFLMPFLVLYFQELGFTGAQIGLLTGLSPLVALVGAPLWTGIADATGRHKLIISLAIGAAVVLALIFPLLNSLGPIIILIALYAFFSAPIVPLSDSATMSMLAAEKEMYGRVRLGGTIGWGLAAPLAGMLIQAYGLKLAFWGYAALMFLALIVSQRFVFGQSATAAPLRSGVRALLTNRRWVLFLTLAFVSGIGFASVNNYLFPYLAELKASKTTMGLALTISTLSELPVLFFANHLLKRFRAHGLLVLAMTITGIRLLLYAAFSFPAGILAFQLLNGMTFPAVWVAGVSYAYENAPPGMSATAQGLFSATVFGFGAAAGGFTGGLLLESIGGRGMYLIFGVLLLASLAIITCIERRMPSDFLNHVKTADHHPD